MLRRKVRPSAPGDILEELLEFNHITVTDAARRIGVTRANLSRLIHGHQTLTPDMAQRLGKLFGNGPRVWLQMQQNVDLWDMLHADSAPYEAIEPLVSDDEPVAA